MIFYKRRQQATALRSKYQVSHQPVGTVRPYLLRKLTVRAKHNDIVKNNRNIILLLNQEISGLLIHRKRSPFPHKGRLYVTLR